LGEKVRKERSASAARRRKPAPSRSIVRSRRGALASQKAAKRPRRVSLDGEGLLLLPHRFRVLVAVRPQGRTTVDLAGHSRIAFKRALQHENVLVGEARSSARTFPLYKEARPPSAATRNAVPPRRREKMSDDAKFILDFG
jgi:hypothetical protein